MDSQSSPYTRREDFMARAGDGTRARVGGATTKKRGGDLNFGDWRRQELPHVWMSLLRS
jgi:hypothetical protein